MTTRSSYPSHKPKAPEPEAKDMEKRVADLEAQVRGLAPLGELLNHISQIKRVFGAGS